MLPADGDVIGTADAAASPVHRQPVSHHTRHAVTRASQEASGHGETRKDHRNWKLVKSALVKAVLSLVLGAGVAAGVLVTHGDGGPGRVAAGMPGRPAGRRPPACVLRVLRLSFPACGSCRTERPCVVFKRVHPGCRLAAARVPTSRNRVRAGCGGTAHGLSRASRSTRMRARLRPPGKVTGGGAAGAAPPPYLTRRPPSRGAGRSRRRRYGYPMPARW